MYDFGVSLLMLVTGRSATFLDEGEYGSEERKLTTWIHPFLSPRCEDLNCIVDPRLNGQYSRAGAMKMAILGKYCINDDPGLRPDMSKLVEHLDELVNSQNP